MSAGIRIEQDERSKIEAETIKAGFLDEGFIRTMRFSELNGPEEYDNTHLFIDWHACFEFGLQQLLDWKEWITRQKEDPELWRQVPEVQRKSIERTLEDINAYDFTKPSDDVKNIWTIRNRLMRWNWNLVVGVETYDGHVGILNGRMARDKGHKKDLLHVVESREQRKAEVSMGEREKRGWHFPGT
jgi:hypothetical protein